jgi:hypothetical protein
VGDGGEPTGHAVMELEIRAVSTISDYQTVRNGNRVPRVSTFSHHDECRLSGKAMLQEGTARAIAASFMQTHSVSFTALGEINAADSKLVQVLFRGFCFTRVIDISKSRHSTSSRRFLSFELSLIVTSQTYPPIGRNEIGERSSMDELVAV